MKITYIDSFTNKLVIRWEGCLYYFIRGICIGMFQMFQCSALTLDTFFAIHLTMSLLSKPEIQFLQGQKQKSQVL
jgi:hypothetical protein